MHETERYSDAEITERLREPGIVCEEYVMLLIIVLALNTHNSQLGESLVSSRSIFG